MRRRKFFLWMNAMLGIGVALGTWSCSESTMPESCSKVYVLVHQDEIELREYEQFIPRGQDYAYFNSEVWVPLDGKMHVYEVNKNIFMKRNAEYLDIKGVVDHSDYIKWCRDNMSPTDTLHILVDDGTDTYTEYNVYNAKSIEQSVDADVSISRDGNRSVLVDYNLEIGDSSQANAQMMMRLDTVRQVECFTLYDIHFKSKETTVHDTYLKGTGSILRVVNGREIRLKSVNGAPMATILSEMCD